MAAARGVERYIRITVDAQQALNQLGNIERSSERAARSTSFLATAMKGLILSEIVQGVFQLGHAITNLGDQALDASARISAVAGSSIEAGALFNRLTDDANRYGLGVSEIATSFTKLRVSVDESLASNEDIADSLAVVSKILATTGAETQQANAVMLQLAQGLGSVAVMGDEFRSIYENAPVLLKAWRDAMGETTLSLKEMSAAGILTAESFFENIQAIDRLSTEMTGMEEPPRTVARALEQLKNETIRMFVELEQGVGVTDIFADAIDRMTEFLVTNKDTVTALLATFANLIDLFVTVADVLGRILGPAIRLTAAGFELLGQVAQKAGDAIAYVTGTSREAQLESAAAQYNRLLENAVELSNIQQAALARGEGDSPKLAQAIESNNAALKQTREELNELENVSAQRGFPEAMLAGADAAANAAKETRELNKAVKAFSTAAEGEGFGLGAFFQEVEGSAAGAARAAREGAQEAAKAQKETAKLAKESAMEAIDAYWDLMRTQERIRKEAERRIELMHEEIARIEAEKLKERQRQWDEMTRALRAGLEGLFRETMVDLFDGGIESASDFINKLRDVLIGGMADIAFGFTKGLFDFSGGGAGGGISQITSWFSSDTIGKNISNLGIKFGEQFGVGMEEHLSKLSGTSNWAFAAGTAIGTAASVALFSGGQSQLGGLLGGTLGSVAGATFGGPAGAVLGGSLGGIFGGGIGSLFGGGGDGIQQMKAIFTFIDGELSATASRLGANAGAFNRLVESYNDIFDAVASGMDQQTQDLINSLQIITDRSSSTSLEEFAAKINTVLTQVIGTAAEAGSAYAQRLQELWDAAGGDIDEFVARMQEFQKLANALATAAENLAGEKVFDSMDQLAEIIASLGDADAAAVVGSLNALERLMESLKTDAQKLFEAEEAVRRVFDELGISIPASAEEFQELVNSLDLTTEEGLLMAKILGEIAEEMGIYLDHLEDQKELTEEVAEATVNFAALMQEALNALISVQTDLGEWRQQVEEFGLSDEELYKRRQAEIDQLVSLLEYGELTPQEIANTVSEIERLSREAWATLTEEQRAAQQDELIKFLNEVELLATARLEASMREITEAAGELTDEMQLIFDEFQKRVQLGARRLEEAGVAAGQELAILSSQGDKYKEAGNSLNNASQRALDASQVLKNAADQLTAVANVYHEAGWRMVRAANRFTDSVNAFNWGAQQIVTAGSNARRHDHEILDRLRETRADYRRLYAQVKHLTYEYNSNLK